MNNEIFRERSKGLAYEVTSLRRCEDEPIAHCGAIQPAGYLLLADRRFHTIRAVGENWPELGGIPAREVIGRNLHDVVKIPGAEGLSSEKLAELVETTKPHLTVGEVEVIGTCHVYEQFLVLELERAVHGGSGQPVSALKELVHHLKDVDTIQGAAAFTANALKRLSGFDRVMVYRFDSRWCGEVIAEAREERLEPFLGLRYPATDIPPQARQLFFQNRCRMIVQVDAGNVPIIGQDIQAGEIDLSDSLFRAVSPIHVQYLVNMGVTASFSTPIRVNEKLWGLIACHHYSGPKHTDHEVRSAFELGSQIVSGKVGDLVARRRLISKNETLTFTQGLLADVSKGLDAAESFSANANRLLSLTTSSGAFVKLGDRGIHLGDCPGPEMQEALINRLRKIETLSIWKSESLSQDLGVEPDPFAAGAIAVPLSLGFEDVLVWFRPEEVQEVRWAGKPRDKEDPHMETVERLKPRNSFAEWRETVENHSRPWSDEDEECGQYILFGFVQGIFAKAQALSQAYLELEAAGKAKDDFISTISHELRTPLSSIIGWLDILKQYPQSYAEAQQAVEVIERNARLQVTLINDLLDVSRIISGKLRLNPQRNLNLARLINDVVVTLRPTAEAKSIAFIQRVPGHLEISADSDRLRQIIWNLATNAIKFTQKGGTVTISAEELRSSVAIAVEDNGVGIPSEKLKDIFGRFHQATPSAARMGGLGLGLAIVKSLTELHGGQVEAWSRGDGQGSRFTVTLPIYALKEEQQEETATQREPFLRSSTKLEGLRILIAEDQPDSREALRILVERNSGTVTVVESGPAALEALRRASFDLILSDIGMPEMDGYQMMEQWRAEERRKGWELVPAIALTAYASSKDRTKALSAGFQSHIPKPVDKDELLAVIDSLGIARRPTA
jgi:chemotaxis family two-component system sensor kinase Cph1